MSELSTVKDLLEDEIKDLYSAEKQLTKAIPKMAKGSNSAELAEAFESHLKETEGQVARLEKVARLLDITPTGKKCAGPRALCGVPGPSARRRHSGRVRSAEQHRNGRL